jgi:SAM-dependent methyltransferase
MTVIWHDLECGAYRADLPVWRSLADRYGDPILDLGAGTGRVSLDLAARGHEVTALDVDPVLLSELARRSAGKVETVTADAREFTLAGAFALCLIPMQTIQLLGGPEGRMRCLRCVREHLRPAGDLAVAIVETVELYDSGAGGPAPLPDMVDRDGVVYFSQPTAVRAQPGAFVLERRRERVGADGVRTIEDNVVRLDALQADQLETEAAAAGLIAQERIEIAPSRDHVGSMVVILGA